MLVGAWAHCARAVNATRRDVVRRHAPQPHKEPFSRYFDGCQGITAFFLAVLITHFALY